MSEPSPLALAALATAAMPDLIPVRAQAEISSVADIVAARVQDNHDRDWLIRHSLTPAAGLRLRQEVSWLSYLHRRSAQPLPCGIPDVAATKALPGGGYVVVSMALPGTPLAPGDLISDAALAREVGRAIGAIHRLPTDAVEEAGLPVYHAREHVQRRSIDVNRAEATGFVPEGLLERWRNALGTTAVWDFTPCVVHTDLAPDTILHASSLVSGIMQWSGVRVADPADDFSWLVGGPDADAWDAVEAGYQETNPQGMDPYLIDRALLGGELAIARWLVYGTQQKDDDIIAMAREALTFLEDPISVD